MAYVSSSKRALGIGQLLPVTATDLAFVLFCTYAQAVAYLITMAMTRGNYRPEKLPAKLPHTYVRFHVCGLGIDAQTFPGIATVRG